MRSTTLQAFTARLAITALIPLLPLIPLAGCVTAYEPITGTPPGVPTPPPQRTARPAEPVRAATQTPVSLRQPLPPAAAPATPAGRQLTWLKNALATGDTRNLEQRFATEFLQQTPAAQIERLIHEWRRDELGAGPVDLAQLEEGETPASLTAFVRGITGRYSQLRLSVDERGRIDTLLLAPAIGFQPGLIETWGRLDDQIAALPGEVSFAAYELAIGTGQALPASALTPVHTFAPAQQLSIGATFKLYILGALAQAVADGRASWDDEIEILDDLKSLPAGGAGGGGQLHLQPQGLLFPARHFARLMMMHSDNSAADHLIDFLGREAVEAYMRRVHSQPAYNTPFLTTMEFFRIKLGPDRATLAPQYIAADVPTRRAMLREGGAVARSTPSLAAASLWRTPFFIEPAPLPAAGGAGWFASSEDLAAVWTDLHRLEQQEGMETLSQIMRANRGLILDRAVWHSIAYKGGSEPGVVSMSWLLERADDRWFILTLTWNDPNRPIELRRATDLVAGAAGLLAQEGRE